MFQTLKPRRSNQGEVEYVTRSSDVGYPRKRRKQPACKFCKVKKLRCNMSDSDGCYQCQSQDINCSYAQRPEVQFLSILNREERPKTSDTHHQPEQPKNQQWPLSKQQQPQLEQALSNSSHSQPKAPYPVQPGKSSSLSFSSKVNNNIIMPQSSQSIDLPLDMDAMDVKYLDGLDSLQFASCSPDMHLSNFSNNDSELPILSRSLVTLTNEPVVMKDNESFSRPSQSMDISQISTGRSISKSRFVMGSMTSDESQTQVLENPAPLQTLPVSTISSAKQQQTQGNQNNNQQTSRSLLAEPPVSVTSPVELHQPRKQNSINDCILCQCIKPVLSAHERLQLQLIWPSVNNRHMPYDAPLLATLPSINMDDVLECQYYILTSINAFLQCRDCTRRSEYIILPLILCQETMRSLQTLRVNSSLAPTRGNSVLHSSPPRDSLARKARERPRSMSTRESSAGSRVITSQRWRLDDESELQAVWGLVDLRIEKLKELIQQLEDVAETNKLSCLKVARDIRRQFVADRAT